MQHFLLLCQLRSQKPVSFVPSPDENFEFCFKKDSLWQSEDLEAIVAHDIRNHGRQIKNILDETHNGHIAALTTDVYGSDESVIPFWGYFGGEPAASRDYLEKVDGLALSEDGTTTFRLSASASQGTLPDSDPWLRLLVGETYSWRHAFVISNAFVQGNKFYDNPIRSIFAPAHGMIVEISNAWGPAKTVFSVKEKHHPNGFMSRLSILKCWK